MFIQFKKELEKAIIENSFIFEYQPLVNIQSNSVVGAEVLIRWNHPQKGLISPSIFIPFAEKYGLIEKIDLFVLNKACQQIKIWQEATGKNIKLSVNISRRHLESNEIVRQLEEIISKTAILPELLELEITETWHFKDTRKAFCNLKAIKSLGITTSIDDFGTGYTTWEDMNKESFDTLKIDRSYIFNLNNFKKINLLKIMILIGRQLGLRLVVEGVEAVDQLNFLRQINCDAYQGYLFSKPLSHDYFLQYLKQNSSNYSNSYTGEVHKRSTFDNREQWSVPYDSEKRYLVA